MRAVRYGPPHRKDSALPNNIAKLFTKYLRRTTSSGMLRRVALVRTDVSEELSASFIGVIRLDELGTTLAVIRN
jgi:hypothetical protein